MGPRSLLSSRLSRFLVPPSDLRARSFRVLESPLLDLDRSSPLRAPESSLPFREVLRFVCSSRDGPLRLISSSSLRIVSSSLCASPSPPRRSAARAGVPPVDSPPDRPWKLLVDVFY